MDMNSLQRMKTLLRKARTTERFYCDRYDNPDEFTLELCQSTARYSFITHALLEGFAHDVVYRIADHVFSPDENTSSLAA